MLTSCNPKSEILPIRSVLLATLAGLLLTACGNSATTESVPVSTQADASTVASDATVLDLSNDILHPPAIGAAIPFPETGADDTATPSPVIGAGEPQLTRLAGGFNSIAIDAGGTTLAGGIPGYDLDEQANTGAVMVRFRVEEQWWFDAMLFADSNSEGARLGHATAISSDGRTIAASAPEHQHNGESSGAVYIFERFGEGWQQTAELVAPSPMEFSRFGQVIALHPQGETLYVSESLPTGRVHVFQKISSQWQYTQTLVSPNDAKTTFGSALGVAENGVLAVSDLGNIYIYRTEGVSPDLWQTIAPPVDDSLDQTLWHRFGEAIAMSANGSNLLISGIEQPLLSSTNQPLQDSVLHKSLVQSLVYQLDETGSWELTATLIPAGSHASDSVQSVAVSADGQQILLGLNNVLSNDNQVSVMSKKTDYWVRTAVLTSPSTHARDFGRTVAITADGNRLLMTASEREGGAVYEWLLPSE
ncbi:MAG: FG-GAP repeat protein [Granulosicoccus sp.]|nr:FG-GAP repeat protein [Granulosicoccus sp.]